METRKTAKMIRAFVALDLPNNIRKEIEKIQAALPAFDGRLTEPENLHLTLKFLGETDEKILIEVKRRLREIKFGSFEAAIGSIGFFDNGKSRMPKKFIVWLEITNCDRLRIEVDKKLSGIFSRERRFMGHLTIARVKGVKNKKYFIGELNKVKIPSGLKFRVENFELKKSELTSSGPIYKTMERYPLV